MPPLSTSASWTILNHNHIWPTLNPKRRLLLDVCSTQSIGLSTQSWGPEFEASAQGSGFRDLGFRGSGLWGFRVLGVQGLGIGFRLLRFLVVD